MAEAPWGPPPWHVDVVPATGPPPARTDVAVVGAGLTGLSAAWHLARRGMRVAVLEADRIGAGASGRTGAIVLEGTAAGPLAGVDDCLPSLARVVAEVDPACALRLHGCWELRHAGDREGVRPLWRDGAQRLCIAGLEPGGTVDAGRLLAGLARAALAAGATIHAHTPALGVDGDRVAVAGGTLRAGHVVLALNAYTPTLVRLPVPVGVALTLALATTPLDAATVERIGLGKRLPFYTIDLPYLWGRLLDDGRLVVGAGLLFPGEGGLAATSLATTEAQDAFARLEGRLRGLHPALAGVGVSRRWGGPIAFVSGRAPLLGTLPGAPRVVVTGGYSGHGVALAVRIGQLVAAAIADGAPLPAWGALEAPR